jgi:hypothetical protein
MKPSDPRWKVAAETALEVQPPDPNVVLHEHASGPKPSYMAISNLRNVMANVEEILGLMNEDDELPAWCEELLFAAKMSTTKALHYIRSKKSQPETTE